MIKKLLSLKKVSSHAILMIFTIRSKRPEQIVLPLKKLKKTNAPLRVVKNQEHRSIAPLRASQLHECSKNSENYRRVKLA